MIRVAFDLDAVLRSRYSGFYTFGSGLLKAIDGLDERPEVLLFFQNKYRRAASELIGGFGAWAIPKSCRVKFRWLENLWHFVLFPSMEFLIGEFDIYHCFHHFMPPASRATRLLTVHDLRRYCLPELYRHSRLKPFEAAVQRADHFIAVSHATKRDLCRIFDIKPGRVDVVHLACAYEARRLTDICTEERKGELLRQYGLDFQDYFVAFSSRDKRKNTKRIVQAFMAALPQLHPKTGLVIIGSLPAGLSFDLPNIFTPGPLDDIISWLECSRGLVFASLYEGFGLPILEGFAAGTPVITSNCSSMPEVAGNAALIVDPYDTRQIKEAIEAVYMKAGLSETLKKAGARRFREFSWETTAEKTLKIYKNICRQG